MLNCPLRFLPPAILGSWFVETVSVRISVFGKQKFLPDFDEDVIIFLKGCLLDNKCECNFCV